MKKTKKYMTMLSMVLFTMMLAACGSGTGGSAIKETKEDSGQKQEEAIQEEGERSVLDEGQKDEAEQGQEMGQKPDIETEQEAGDGQKNETVEQAETLCGIYFKSGDASYRLEITPGEPEHPDELHMWMIKRDAEYSYAASSQEYWIPYESGKSSYQMKEEDGGEDYTLEIEDNHMVRLTSGDGKKIETYYARDKSLMLPDSFERPLNDTDLIGLGKDDIRILRNQFYAVYGRTFKDENLKSYFEGQPWYHDNISPEDFSEDVFSVLEKRNIAFLQKTEDSYDEKQAADTKLEYDALEMAPYQNLLPEYGEVAVSLYADKEHTVDRGIYYEAQGTISIPVTVTAEQYQAMERGESVEVTLDELSGETAMLKKTNNSEYGNYIFEEDEKNGYETDMALAYDADMGVYRLWQGSDDTIFKKIYEGPVCVLKGASKEYRGYFEMEESEIPDGASDYGIMDFDGETADEPGAYWGNKPVFDSKGYIKALYFFGD